MTKDELLKEYEERFGFLDSIIERFSPNKSVNWGKEIRHFVQKLAETPPPAVKILIACPTFGLDPHPGKWLLSMLTIVQDLKRAGVEFGFKFPYRKPIHRAENEIIRFALTGGYTHILRIDDDVWGIQPGDVIKLLAADKEFISAVMFVRGFPYSRCAFVKKDPKLTLLQCEKVGRGTLLEVDGEGVIPVDLTAFPFTLWKTSIFDRMIPPYFDVDRPESPDAQFCQKCLDLGIQPFVHMDIQINHQHVTPWNRLALFNADAREALMKKSIEPSNPLYDTLVDLFGVDGCKDLYILKGTGREPKITETNETKDE